MTFVTQSIRSLNNGISQQPELIRQESQGKEQINGWSTENEGLQKRPPLVFLTIADSSTEEKSQREKRSVSPFFITSVPRGDQPIEEEHVHEDFISNLSELDPIPKPKETYFKEDNYKDTPTIITEKSSSKTNRYYYFFESNNVKYCLVFTPSSLKMITLHTSSVDSVFVEGPSLNNYIKYFDKTTDLKSNIRIVVVQDQLFVLNKDKKVVLKNNINKNSVNVNKDILIVITGSRRDATAKIRFQVEFGNDKHIVDIPLELSSSQDKTLLKIEDIINTIREEITSRFAEFCSDQHYDIQIISNNVFHIRSKSIDFTFSSVKITSDPTGLVYGFSSDVQDFTQLPLEAPNGYIVKVGADVFKENTKGYYLKYDEETKTWQETVGWYADSKIIDSSSMPHVLSYTSESLTFTTADWGNRVAGDNDTSKNPSFIDNKINDIFFLGID